MSKNPSSLIIFYHYDLERVKEKPKEVANRCTAEIIVLSNELSIASKELSASVRQKDPYDVVASFKFHYENSLFRIYSLRERIWDILAALAGIPRMTMGNEKFRKSVNTIILKTNPSLLAANQKLWNLIEADLRSRNVTTHQTLLIVGIAFESQWYDLINVLDQADPKSKEGIENEKMVRKELREFVKEHNNHILEVRKVALEFVRLCQTAIDNKVW